MPSTINYMFRFSLKAGVAVAALTLFAQGVMAADGTQAVSGLNGSVDVSGGAAKGNMVGLLTGKVTAPVTHDFGVQFDGSIGTIGGETAKSIAGHAFYRDPTKELIGVILQRGWYTGLDFDRYGVEGEYYNNNMTYRGRIGYQDGDSLHGEFTTLELGYYLNNNWVVTPGFNNSVGHVWASVGTEWQPNAIKALPGMNVFASTGGGNHGYAFGLLGVRYYFGNDKDLILRHRQDDPMALTPDGMTGNFPQFKTPAPAAAPAHCVSFGVNSCPGEL